MHDWIVSTEFRYATAIPVPPVVRDNARAVDEDSDHARLTSVIFTFARVPVATAKRSNNGFYSHFGIAQVIRASDLSSAIHAAEALILKAAEFAKVELQSIGPSKAKVTDMS